MATKEELAVLSMEDLKKLVEDLAKARQEAMANSMAAQQELNARQQAAFKALLNKTSDKDLDALAVEGKKLPGFGGGGLGQRFMKNDLNK